jgi:hypothetical protein
MKAEKPCKECAEKDKEIERLEKRIDDLKDSWDCSPIIKEVIQSERERLIKAVSELEIETISGAESTAYKKVLELLKGKELK